MSEVVDQQQQQEQPSITIEDQAPNDKNDGDNVVKVPNSNESGGSFKLTVEPLHHPQEMAHVEVPHNVENIPHGKTLMTGKELLAKKMATTGTSFYSPSDSLVSPCTQKLSSQKGKRWANAKVKPTVFGKSNLNNTSNLFSPASQSSNLPDEPIEQQQSKEVKEEEEAKEGTIEKNVIKDDDDGLVHLQT